MMAAVGLTACLDVKSPTFIPDLLDLRVCEQIDGQCPTIGSACVANGPLNPSIVPLNKSVNLCALGQFEGLSSPDDGINEPPYWQDLTNLVTWSVEAGAEQKVEFGADGLVIGRERSENSLKINASMSGETGGTFLQVTDPVLEQVDINPQGSRRLLQNTELQLECFGQYSGDAACAGLTSNTCNVTADASFASTDAAVVSVSNAEADKGLGSALAAGSADVTCTFEGLTSEIPASLTVCALDTITSVEIQLKPPASLPPAPLAVGGTLEFQLIASYTDCVTGNPATQDITSSATWSSDRADVATIDGNGSLTAVGPGLATISAEFAGREIDPVQISVLDANLLRVEVTGPSVVFVGLEATASYTAQAIFQDPDTLEELDPVDVTSSPDTQWSSADPASLTFETVDSSIALVQPDAPAGTVTITAMHSGVSGSFDTVLQVPVVKGLEVAPELACVGDLITLGEVVQATAYAIVDAQNAAGETVACSVNATEVAEWEARGGTDLPLLNLPGSCADWPSLSTDPFASPVFVSNTSPKGQISGNPDAEALVGLGCVQARYGEFSGISSVLVLTDLQFLCDAWSVEPPPSVDACTDLLAPAAEPAAE